MLSTWYGRFSFLALITFLLLVNVAIGHDDHVVVDVTDDGFSLESVKIKIGEEVTWINKGNSPRWPASDIHPTHTLYPGSDITKCGKEQNLLDSCGSLKSGQEFTFTFSQKGKWGIHDHLSPGHTMYIEVVDDEEKSFNLFSILRKLLSFITGFFAKTSVYVPEINEFRLMGYVDQKNIIKEISASDPAKAWGYLKSAYTVDGQIKENPHELSHIVGNALYTKNGLDGISVCDPAFAFGCYHGVAEEMLSDVGVDGISEIEDSCYKFFSKDTALAASCIHGIGHGLATWESLDVAKALNDCDVLASNNRIYCYDGVFMEYSFGAVATDDEWKFCGSLDEKYQSMCAKYHVYIYGRNNGWNFSELGESCDNAPNEILRSNCLSGLGFSVANAAQGNPDKINEICSTIQSDGKYTCITFAAVETIFQAYSNWYTSFVVLCNSLPSEWKENCMQRTTETITAYNRKIEYPEEIQKIKATENLDEQALHYKELIERVGPEQAQEDLYRSGMPFTGQTHLLNHVVGDYLYEKYGATGLVYCKDYFLASCYHGVILHAIGDYGIDGMDEVINECKKFGITVTAQCSHALGHGFLTWTGYEKLDQAPYLCDDISKKVDGFPVFNCLDGVFMENIWGVHEGKPSEKRWVNESDPFYPCNDSRINPNHLSGCWANQPSLMYQMFKGDLAKVGEYCLKVENSSLKTVCFNALARQIHPLTKGDVNSTFQLCNLLPSEWVNYCLTTIVLSDFSVGGRDLSYKICEKIDDIEKSNCYASLFGVIGTYAKSFEEYNNWCLKISDVKWQNTCMSFKSKSL